MTTPPTPLVDFTDIPLQDLFNKSVAGLAAQDWQRARDGGVCRYDVNGLRCAIGQLIDDPETRFWLDRATSLPSWGALHDAGTVRGHLDALSRLQDCHDLADDASNMRARLRHYAAFYHLIVPDVLKEAP